MCMCLIYVCAPFVGTQDGFVGKWPELVSETMLQEELTSTSCPLTSTHTVHVHWLRIQHKMNMFLLVPSFLLS